MGKVCRALGTALIGISLGGLLWLLVGAVLVPTAPVAASISSRLADVVARAGGVNGPAGLGVQSAGPLARAPKATSPRSINRLVIPRIGLDAPVVPARIITVDGARTWAVPAFAIGHAAGTAEPGQEGNVVLVGHISSLHSGDVFAGLGRLQAGDRVEVFTKGERLDYRVVDARAVARADLSVVQPTATPTLTMITCAGLWLPSIHDYTERLVVQAAPIATASAHGGSPMN